MTNQNERSGLRTRLARLCRRSGADLKALLALTVVTDLFASMPILRESPGRVLFGLAFVLFAPGYAIVAALFPRRATSSETDVTGRRGLGGAERFALSIVTSGLLVPVLAIVLSVTSIGVRLGPLVVGLSAVTVGVAGYAAVRRSRLPADIGADATVSEFGPRAPGDSVVPWSRDWTGFDIALAIVTVLALASIGFTVFAPASDGYTELYLTTENESGDLVARDYPQTVTVGSAHDLTLGIRNHEGVTTDYTVVVELQRVATTNETTESRGHTGLPRTTPTDVRVLERTEVRRFEPDLAPNETWLRQHSVSPSFAGERVRLVYLLYRDDAPADPSMQTAYREVHLWLTVSESATGTVDEQ